jgi:leucyl aminopeptidase
LLSLRSNLLSKALALPIMSALPQYAPFEISKAASAHSIALGFIKSQDGNFEFVSPLASDVEKFFALNLVDELTFFAPTGKAGELFEVPVSAENSETDRLFLVGIGDQSGSAARAAGAALGRKVRGKNTTVYAACVVSEIKSFAISVSLGAWVWNLKTEKKQEEPTIFVASKDAQLIKDAAAIAQAICRTRDLVHTPANIKNPAWMAKQAEDFAKGTGLTVKVFAGAALKEFGGLRAVGGSSPKPGPRMIQVTYQPKSKKKSAKALPHVVLVGKGITFDTGGVSLKRPYDTMMAMKSDMAGAAAILGTLTALEHLQPNVQVTALMMMAENAISGTAQRPSDVIKHYGGTTVEVINTDAEGRLVLADGLAYADANLDPDYLVDIATLTGAATLGLGRQYAAMYTRDNALAAALSKAGDATGDRVWHMPLVDDYKEALRSDIADLNHTADKGKFSAGSVTAALFLENFTATRRWVHLDIAGTARSEVDAGENSKGGTGFGVRLLTEWINSLS